MIETSDTTASKPRAAEAAGMFIVPLLMLLPSAYLFYLGFTAAPYVYGVWLYAPLALLLLLSRFRMFAALALKPVVGITCLHGLAVLLGLA